MEILIIHSRNITDEEKELLKRKGFKIIETKRIKSGLYEGDEYTISIPETCKIFPTNSKNTFYVCYNYLPILSVYYPTLKTAGDITFFEKSSFWS